MALEIAGRRFLDEHGRRLVLRGVNLGGSSKQPFGMGFESACPGSLENPETVSFVGRPFPLAEADEHFGRLKSWGLDFLRLVVTWEAIEHAGPGALDEAYLDYLERLAAKAGDWGFRLFVDPHQDVWSRWTGGDGAPAWTLDRCGFDLANLHDSGAAYLHAAAGPAYRRMSWPSNYNRLACATMFTLFYGGDDFAPGLEIEGLSAQEFLQSHFLDSMGAVAARLARFPHVLGFDSLNEPSSGFIGLRDLSRLERALSKVGPMPSPFEAMAAGDGYAVEVDVYGVRGLGQNVVGRERLGEAGLRAWKPSSPCVWKAAGVWDDADGTPELLRPDWFAERSGRPLDFNEDYLKPFARRLAAVVRKAEPGFAIFVETVPNAEPLTWTEADGPKAVNAAHWYDGLTLFLKRWTGFLAFDPETERPIIGSVAVRRHFKAAIARIAERSRALMGDCPTLLGEFGLPFDLNGARAYRSGRFGAHVAALSAYFDAVDASLVDATIWNYTADNGNALGDGWNGEDLSIYSRDQAGFSLPRGSAPIESGGRAIEGFCRPYPRATAGEPEYLRFDRSSGAFEYRYRVDPAVSEPTEIFLPPVQYPHGARIEVEGGTFELDAEARTLWIRADSGASLVVVCIRRRAKERSAPS